MNANKALWEKGDFTQIADCMRQSGEEFVERLAISPGEQLLDLGCGDGTTAIPAAQRGADVTGVDIAANLVEAGRRRAAQARLANIHFQEGDACHLDGLDDDGFDRVVSIFGAMFAPDPEAVALEMVRVTKPGGSIVMGNWIPGDPTLVAQILKTCAEFTPPPPEGFVSQMRWGEEAVVRERFAKAGIDGSAITCAPDHFVFRCDGSPIDLLARFLNFYGPTMNALDAARQAGREEELRDRLEQLFASQNRSDDPARTEIAATFLKVTATKPG
jgi:ubiquinone/menaquinone biosynthesis C-methylase UbiE